MTARDLFREGDWLGDYEIRGRLRAGGMATLFLAQRHGAAGVSRPVVIKVIHPHLAEDEAIVRMFIDEARISSHISHSNVVYVEKFGEHDGVYYIVMEYVDGVSLQQLLRALAAEGRKLSAAVAVHLAIEVAAGLHAAHETTGEDGTPLGVVHRDVSPSNVLLTRDGRIKVIDFGIAKARGRLGGTRSGSGLKGKIRYMSPEQAWSRPIDRRSDIYALGICLWELLTCRALFRAKDDLAVLELVRDPVIPPPSKYSPEISPELDAIVLRATAKLPGDRHQTALELRRDLMSAVPAAIAIPPELIGELVHHVRIPDRAATAELATGTFEDITEPSTRAPESSVSGAVGELRPHAWRNRGLVAAGILAACAVGVVIATAGRSDDAVRTGVRPPPAIRLEPPQPRGAPQPAGAPPSPVAMPSAAPGDAPAKDPTIAPATAETPAPTTPAAPAETAATAPTAPAVIRPPIRPAAHPPRPDRPDKARVMTIQADGAVLADEPAPPQGKPAPRPRPKPDAVRVDDAVLAR